MNKYLAACWLACASLAPLAAQCADFYVAPRGDDQAAGSQAAPCLSHSAGGSALVNDSDFERLSATRRDAPRQADGSPPFKGAAPDIGGFSAP